MKTFPLFIGIALAACPLLHAQSTNYANFIRQKQLPTGVVWDMPVNTVGEGLSPLAINPGGAQFELWTVNNVTAASYLLESRYVGAYVPMANVTITSEDPYAVIPRTRADRPYTVSVAVDGLKTNDPNAPAAATMVNFLRHVQSYGATGTGLGLNRTQATLLMNDPITTNGGHTYSFAINSVPGTNRAKVRGEERFSVFSLEDYQAPELQLSSQFIQIWPVADATIAGMTPGQLVRFKLPSVTLTFNDLYPDSHTYAQVYKGSPQLGKSGTIVPGSSIVINDTVPQSRVLTLVDYDAAFTDDGTWTMEILTKTPFGLERLNYVSFVLDRTIQMNASVTTTE
ncbi:hypothetical protein [Haloferula sp. BvORR071]|uniref:hypothetical protein n=1 Tax=Haloferula sp. BvORR071 TaxID=1396141 RepID=UPI00054F99D5|nr:hypothetical protein [Haloferula sp. BvORR071]